MYKIYKIVDNTTNNIYIGQTKCRNLSTRIANHRHDFKRDHTCSSILILKNNDWRYELIEETDDITREIYWIQNTPNCINKIKFLFDDKPRKKEYYIENKNKINKRNNNYYENNKENVLERTNWNSLWRAKFRLKLICDWIDILNSY